MMSIDNFALLAQNKNNRKDPDSPFGKKMKF
jgi:hypothetical protein